MDSPVLNSIFGTVVLTVLAVWYIKQQLSNWYKVCSWGGRQEPVVQVVTRPRRYSKSPVPALEYLAI